MPLLARAPTRIDLAGGTLDIWPVYLMLEQAATVNVAIDLYAEVSIEPATSTWCVTVEDGGRQIESPSPAQLSKQAGAEIAGTLLGFFAPDEPVSITTRSQAPLQSGLGASSALGIALAGGLNELTGSRYEPSDLIEIVKNTEAKILGTMTGAQDHYPPVYGGASCLWWGMGSDRREPLPLEQRLAREAERRLLGTGFAGRAAFERAENPRTIIDWPFIDTTIDSDFSNRGGVTTNTANYSTLATGDLFYMDARVFFLGNDIEPLSSLRFDLGRKDADGALFGMPGLTEITAGDVFTPQMPLAARSRGGRDSASTPTVSHGVSTAADEKTSCDRRCACASAISS